MDEPHVNEHEAVWTTVVAITLLGCIRRAYDGPGVHRGGRGKTFSSVQEVQPGGDDGYYCLWVSAEAIIENEAL